MLKLSEGFPMRLIGVFGLLQGDLGSPIGTRRNWSVRRYNAGQIYGKESGIELDTVALATRKVVAAYRNNIERPNSELFPGGTRLNIFERQGNCQKGFEGSKV
jgi:hypothetical protein